MFYFTALIPFIEFHNNRLDFEEVQNVMVNLKLWQIWVALYLQPSAMSNASRMLQILHLISLARLAGCEQ